MVATLVFVLKRRCPQNTVMRMSSRNTTLTGGNLVDFTMSPKGQVPAETAVRTACSGFQSRSLPKVRFWRLATLLRVEMEPELATFTTLRYNTLIIRAPKVRMNR